MAEATKLFDKSGGAASGNKQDAVNGAAMTVMKLLVQSKFSGAIGGGNSGGLGGLLSLVCPSYTSNQQFHPQEETGLQICLNLLPYTNTVIVVFGRLKTNESCISDTYQYGG
jgi:hypothetical protein